MYLYVSVYSTPQSPVCLGVYTEHRNTVYWGEVIVHDFIWVIPVGLFVCMCVYIYNVCMYACMYVYVYVCVCIRHLNRLLPRSI